jgi:NADPH:quinone reductase-like Zn-dependent oxidoreductase
MRGYVIDHYDHPSKLQLRSDVPEPAPKPDEVVVEVYRCATGAGAGSILYC